MKGQGYAKPLMVSGQPSRSGRFGVGRIRPPQNPGIPSAPMEQIGRSIQPPQDAGAVQGLVDRMRLANQQAINTAGQGDVNQQLLARLKMQSEPAMVANDRASMQGRMQVTGGRQAVQPMIAVRSNRISS